MKSRTVFDLNRLVRPSLPPPRPMLVTARFRLRILVSVERNRPAMVWEVTSFYESLDPSIHVEIITAKIAL